jgi:hypothetical protein
MRRFVFYARLWFVGLIVYAVLAFVTSSPIHQPSRARADAVADTTAAVALHEERREDSGDPPLAWLRPERGSRPGTHDG